MRSGSLAGEAEPSHRIFDRFNRGAGGVAELAERFVAGEEHFLAGHGEGFAVTRGSMPKRARNSLVRAKGINGAIGSSIRSKFFGSMRRVRKASALLKEAWLAQARQAVAMALVGTA